MLNMGSTTLKRKWVLCDIFRVLNSNCKIKMLSYNFYTYFMTHLILSKYSWNPSLLVFEEDNLLQKILSLCNHPVREKNLHNWNFAFDKIFTVIMYEKKNQSKLRELTYIRAKFNLHTKYIVYLHHSACSDSL
jgi:hypothetical protein